MRITKGVLNFMNTLAFNLKLYPIKYIKSCISIYNTHVKAEYDIDYKQNKVFIKFLCPDDYYELVKDEFCNYLIGLIVKNEEQDEI